MTAPARTSLKLRWHGHSDRGKVRVQNEDAFLALRFDAQECQYLGKVGDASVASFDFVFAVSDGMGGALAGEFASKIAVEKITRLLPRAFKQTAVGLEAGYPDVLAELFDQIHRSLLFLGRSYAECSGMGATLSLCWFTPGWMFWGHIGDSRIYYLPASVGDGIKQLSQDDTHVGWLYRQGQLNEREARNHPRRNVLQKALGAGHQFIDPQVGAVACEPGDRFLLCTDGLIDGLYDQRIEEHLRVTDAVSTQRDPSLRLVAAALEQSGRDNTTALVVEIMNS